LVAEDIPKPVRCEDEELRSEMMHELQLILFVSSNFSLTDDVPDQTPSLPD
jgi:hypothetical protein